MALDSTDTAALLRPEQVGPLVVQPVDRESVAVQASTVIDTTSSSFRVPIITDDPAAGWVNEGAEIPLSDMVSSELNVVPRKLAALTVISRELSEDSSPAAQATVGQAIARDIARKLDAAYFGAVPAPAPSGLAALEGVTAVTAGAAFADLDPFAEAISKAEDEGAVTTSFVANPADALTLAQLTDEDGSRRPLLGTDPTSPTRRMIFGVPLLVSPAVVAGTVWALPRDRAMVVRRSDTRVEISDQAFFSSDSIAVRATMRLAFAFPHPAAVGQITVTP